MRFGAVGDLHGDFDSLDRIMARHPDVAFWVCPGDLASESGEYPRTRAPLYWIKGNNEDFDFVAAQPPGSGTIPNLHYIPNGISVQTSAGLTLAGLGGTFAPTWYETPAAQLPVFVRKPRSGRLRQGSPPSPAYGAVSPEFAEIPRTTADGEPRLREATAGAGRRGHASEAAGAGRGAPTAKDDRRRHFVREEVDACKQLTGVDIFLSHEAARPFLLETQRKTGPARPIDAGKTPINEVLSALQPRLHLFGHHHKYAVAERQHVPSIGLDAVASSYLIFDGKTLAHQRLTT